MKDVPWQRVKLCLPVSNSDTVPLSDQARLVHKRTCENFSQFSWPMTKMQKFEHVNFWTCGNFIGPRKNFSLYGMLLRVQFRYKGLQKKHTFMQASKPSVWELFSIVILMLCTIIVKSAVMLCPCCACPLLWGCGFVTLTTLLTRDLQLKLLTGITSFTHTCILHVWVAAN